MGTTPGELQWAPMRTAPHPAPAATNGAVLGLEALTPLSTDARSPASGPDGTPDAPQRPWRVAAVCPCFNRPQDLEILLRDFARQDLRGIDLSVTIVDNASTKPLSSLRRPPGLDVEFLRMETNSGGSGGFNAGMTHVLRGDGEFAHKGEPDFVWWVDSDARVGRRCLRSLVSVLAKRPLVGAVGAAMGEIPTAQIWECGGRIFKSRGTFGPAARDDIDRRALIKCHYVAACCALVRASAIRETGLFPENFIYYDDIDWCLSMTRRTGLVCRATRKARAFHPPGIRRFATWGRYYIARNGYSLIEILDLGPAARFRRALFELPRAAAQTIMGLDALGALHLKGLRDAAENNFAPIEPKDLIGPLGFQPFSKLPERVREELAAFGPYATLYVHPLLKNSIPGFEPMRAALRQLSFAWPRDWRKWKRRQQGSHLFGDLVGAARRALLGPTADVAIVPTGWPTNWFRGRVMIQVTADGFLVNRPRPLDRARKAGRLLAEGLGLALRIAVSPPPARPLPPAPQWAPRERAARSTAEAAACSA